MKDFVYAIASILLALLTVVAIDAYLILSAYPTKPWQNYKSFGIQFADGLAASPGWSKNYTQT